MTGWTANRVDRMKTLWLAGASASEIANELGGVTRNAVLGKVDRLKLVRLVERKATGNKRRADTTERKAPSRSIGLGPISDLKVDMLIVDDLDERPSEGARDAVNAWLGGLTLTQLTNTTCRWPIGTPGAPGFCFCGAGDADLNGGRPYCRKHMRLNRRPTP